MAVSKELLARYKEMKAKGINITLTELKKQMEEEENITSSPIEQASNESAQAFESNPTQSENTWTTTYSNNNCSKLLYFKNIYIASIPFFLFSSESF